MHVKYMFLWNVLVKVKSWYVPQNQWKNKHKPSIFFESLRCRANNEQSEKHKTPNSKNKATEKQLYALWNQI